jgi:hypothetical protein
LKKRTKKLLFLWRLRVALPSPQPVSQVKKFFCFFLFTKRSLSSALPSSQGTKKGAKAPLNARNLVLEAFALNPLALHFTGAADSFGGFARAALGRLFVVPAEFHFAEHAFALKFLFERLQRLVDVIVANENLHLAGNS